MASSSLLFGGEYKWTAEDWTASDDRVRGGKSQSYLDASEDGHVAIFHGNLDIKTLGGAGFASQRTIGENWVYDLSSFDGIQIKVAKSDGKRYTFIMKDEIPEKRTDGRDESNISWEVDFGMSSVEAERGVLSFSWSDFKPTYRGREMKNSPPLKTNEIKRFSLMMRSHFGQQEGDFSLSLDSIAAYKNSKRSSQEEPSVLSEKQGLAVDTKRESEASDESSQPAQPNYERHRKFVAKCFVTVWLTVLCYMLVNIQTTGDTMDYWTWTRRRCGQQ